MSLLEGQESEEEVEPSRPLNYPRLVAANLCLRLLPQTSTIFSNTINIQSRSSLENHTTLLSLH